jgi:hypothetical protein
MSRGLILMSMQVASLEVLEKANVPAPQARAIVQAIEIEIGSAQTILATKQDLAVAIAGVETKIEASARGILTQMYLSALTQLSILLGAAYFFVTHIKP